jgi:hypothetical protein
LQAEVRERQTALPIKVTVAEVLEVCMLYPVLLKLLEHMLLLWAMEVLEVCLKAEVEKIQLDLALQQMVVEEEDIIVILLVLVEQDMVQEAEVVILQVAEVLIIIIMMVQIIIMVMMEVRVQVKEVAVAEEPELV